LPVEKNLYSKEFKVIQRNSREFKGIQGKFGDDEAGAMYGTRYTHHLYASILGDNNVERFKETIKDGFTGAVKVVCPS